MKANYLAVLAISLLACPRSPVAPVPPDADGAVPAPVDASADRPLDALDGAPIRSSDVPPHVFPNSACGRACAAMEMFGCIEAEPTAKGITCDVVCERVIATVGVALPIACILDAGSPQAMHACGVCR